MVNRKLLGLTLKRLYKQKVMSTLTLSSLILGLLCALIIASWAVRELSYDQEITESSQIFRITSRSPSDSSRLIEFSPYLIGEFAERHVPGVEDVGRLYTSSFLNPIFFSNGRCFYEKSFAYVDEGWLRIQHFHLLSGTISGFDREINALIITKSKAIKLFGSTQALDQLVKIDSVLFKIKGIIEDIPANRSYSYDIFVPISGYLSNKQVRENEMNWGVYNYITLLKIKKETKPVEVGSALSREIKAHLPTTDNAITLQNISNVHFETNLSSNATSHVNPSMIHLALTLSFLIMIAGAINFSNISAIQFANAEKDNSVKQVLGCSKYRLFYELVMDRLFIIFICTIFVLILLPISFAIINSYSGFTLSSSIFFTFRFAIVTISLLAGTLIGSSFLPALQSLKLVKVSIKGKFDNSKRKYEFRRLLLGVQFVITFGTLSAAFIMTRQIRYIISSSKSQSGDGIVKVSLPKELWITLSPSQRNTVVTGFKNSLLKYPAISNVTTSNRSFYNLVPEANTELSWSKMVPGFVPFVAELDVDNDFNTVFPIQLEQGNWFRAANLDGTHKGFIVNETAVKTFGWREPIIGKEVILNSDTGQIIGVIKDYNFQSMHSPIAPEIIHNNGQYRFELFVKGRTGDAILVIAKLKNAWSEFFPNFPFDYTLMTEDLRMVYERDIKMQQIVSFLSVVALAISVFGLLSMILYTLKEKRKDFAIMRILGAAFEDLFKIVITQYLVVAVIAIAVAIPICFYFLSRWLESFSYRSGHFSIAFLGNILILLGILLFLSFTLLKLDMRKTAVKGIKSE